MGKVIKFSQFEDYYKELTQKSGKPEGTILDANVIITLSYEPKKYHSRILDFLENHLYPKNIQYFTTVNTTFEYLEFHRRLLMTEGLRDAIDQFSKLNLSNKKRQIIRQKSGILKNRENTQGKDPVFYDGEIKEIRKKFCSKKDGLKLWSALSKNFLTPKLQEEYEALNGLGISYLSINDPTQQSYFHKTIEWKDAIKVCSSTCASMSDSMILNALQCTNFPFAISLDTDVIYATLADKSIKDIIVPDDLITDNKELNPLLE